MMHTTTLALTGFNEVPVVLCCHVTVSYGLGIWFTSNIGAVNFQWLLGSNQTTRYLLQLLSLSYLAVLHPLQWSVSRRAALRRWVLVAFPCHVTWSHFPLPKWGTWVVPRSYSRTKWGAFFSLRECHKREESSCGDGSCKFFWFLPL